MSGWSERQQEMEQWYRQLLTTSDAAIACFDHDYKPCATFLERLNGRVLDLGGGAGITRHFLTPGVDYIVLDPSLEWRTQNWMTLAHAYPCLAHDYCFVRGCGEHIPFQNRSFDAVVALWSLNHVEDPEAVIREVARVLRGTGSFVMVLEDMTPRWRDILTQGCVRVTRGKAILMLARKLWCTLRRQPWPLQTDHLRIAEDELRGWTRPWFRPVARRWAAGYFTIELERYSLGLSP